MKSETTFMEKEQIIWVDLQGFFDVQKTQDEVDIFEASMDQLPLKDLTLVIDSTDLAVFKREIIPILEHCYALYSRFKRCIMVDPASPTAKLQLHKAAKNVEGFTGEFVSTTAEAKALLNL
ncbi:hypothetical protein M3231_17800 [Neobacillus mesonae]|nr:hypothetical protein [Neobacillus mesonae]